MKRRTLILILSLIFLTQEAAHGMITISGLTFRAVSVEGDLGGDNYSTPRRTLHELKQAVQPGYSLSKGCQTPDGVPKIIQSKAENGSIVYKPNQDRTYGSGIFRSVFLSSSFRRRAAPTITDLFPRAIIDLTACLQI
ncbi:MAG: hypothetical protein V1742_12650 [Pseudomonadota bacterium]